MSKTPSPPPRYAVQRPKGKSWITLHIDDDRDAALRVFQQLTAPKPRCYFRVIILEFESDSPIADFRWKLLQLYDPFKSGARSRSGDAAGKPAASPERVPMPLRIWALAAFLGLLAGAVMFYTVGARPV